MLEVSGGLTVCDDVGLGEVVGCACFFVAEEVGVAFGALVGDGLAHPPAVPLGFGFALGELEVVALPVGDALAVPVPLSVGVTLWLGLSVGLAGGVVVAVDGLGDGLVVVGVGDGLTFGVALGVALGVAGGVDEHVGAGAVLDTRGARAGHCSRRPFPKVRPASRRATRTGCSCR